MSGLAHWINDSFRRRIAFLVWGLLLVVTAGLSVVSYLQILRVTRELRSDRMRQLGEQLAPILSRGSLEGLGTLARLSRDSVILGFVASGGKAASRGLVERRIREAEPPAMPSLVLIDGKGKLVAEVTLATRTWEGPLPEVPGSIPADSAPHIGPLRRFNDSTVIFDIRVPLRQGNQLIGALVQRGRLALSANSKQTIAVLLGARTGIVLGSPTTDTWTDLGAVVPQPPASAVRIDTVARTAWQGEEVLSLAQKVQGTPWLLVIRTDYAAVSVPARGYLRRAAFLGVLVILLGTGVAVVVGRRLSRPIEEITELTEQIVSGDEGRRAREEIPGEVGRLGRAFNAMVDRVASSTRRLRENEASLRAFVTHASEGIWRIEFVPPISTGISRDLQIESWYKLSPLAECNASLARMHGLEASPEGGMVPLELLFPSKDPLSHKLLASFIENGYRCAEAESIQNGNGDAPRRFVNDLIGIIEQGGLRRIWGTRRDVTVERLMDERLAQTQRLEAIGRLAGGVAHDFNNLLTAILGYSETLKDGLPADHPGHQDAGEIDRLCARAAELTRQLLAFSRGQVLRPAHLDLNQVVAGTEALLRRVIGEDIELKLQLGEPQEIEADASQIERVIMNLALNARDAMPAGGVLELRTGLAQLDSEYGRLRPGVVPGSYAMLAVSDTGVGMTDAVQAHIFEPFFTTKPKGSGTGLGLSTVYGIVRQSGGDISVYSEAGKGTTFKIFLPVKSPRRSMARAMAVSPLELEHSGKETVLLVEDEAPVRDIVRRALGGAGYTVLVARDGREAQVIGEEHLGKIDLVLTDMILPGISGRDLAMEFRRKRPDLKVVIMSGYTGEGYPALDALPPGIGYLEKPFALADLRRKVRETLDAPSSTTASRGESAPPR